MAVPGLPVRGRSHRQRRALELSITGRSFSAQEALTWGLIHHVAHAFEAEDRAFGIASDISKGEP